MKPNWWLDWDSKSSFTEIYLDETLFLNIFDKKMSKSVFESENEAQKGLESKAPTSKKSVLLTN